MAFVYPTVSDFKTFFSRDFPYSTDPNVGVTDTDIERAFQETNCMFNVGLFCDDPCAETAYLYLAAYNLVTNIAASSQGLSGQYDWLTSSKSVGSVSVGLSIPQKILDNPYYAMLAKNPYGAKYLQMVLPFLVGQMFSVCGGTNP